MHLNASQLNLLEAIESGANAPRMGEKSAGEEANIPAGVSRHSRGLQRIKQDFDCAGETLPAVRAPVEAFVGGLPVGDLLSQKALPPPPPSLEEEVRV